MKHGFIFNVTQKPFLSRPLGGHRIAHYLRELDWDIEVVDWANWWPIEQLKEFFKSRYTKETVFAGFGHLFSMWPDHMEEFAKWIKDQYPSVTLISGSAVNPMFKSKYLDYYIQGFGEYAIEALLKYLTGNGAAPYFNLEVPNGIKVISAITSYPAFPMHSLTVKYEKRDFIDQHEWLTIETSRGCKFNCDFCNFPVLGVKEDHTRTAIDFENQIKDTYDRFGVTHYLVADETFNDSVSKIKKYADVIEKLEFETWFSGYIRADLMISRRENYEHLLRMNFLGHYYGIESFKKESSKSISKGMDPDRIKQGLIDTKKYFTTHGSKKYRGSMGLIVGLPHETETDITNTFNWLVTNWQEHSFSFHALTLPLDNKINRVSKISSNLIRYGYQEMTQEEIANFKVKSNDFTTHFSHIFSSELRRHITEEIIWKNNDLNWFDAQRITNYLTKEKDKHNFKPSCFGLSYRLQDNPTIDERLKLNFPEFDSNLNSNIQSYINKKLSC